MKKSIFVIITAVALVAAMALSCMAATFVYSIEGKEFPDYTVDGIADKNKEIVQQVEDGDVIIIPYSKRDSSEITDAKDALDKSFEEIKNAASLNDLCDGLDEVADSIVKGATAKDLSVTDLFYVDYTGTVPQSAQDGYLVLTIDLSKYNSKYHHAFMVKTSDGTWKVVDSNLVTYSDDGTTVYLKVSDFASTVAILQMNDNVVIKGEETEDKPQSPQTGLLSNTTAAYVVAGCAVVLAAAVVITVIAKKKKFQ